MGFNNSNGSHQQAKRVLPRIQSVPKSNNQYNQLEDGLRGHKTGLDHMHRKKVAVVFPESEVKDLDIEKQLNCTEGLSDEIDFIWLSSDFKSPSMLSSDDSQDFCWDLSLHDRFSPMLSLSGSYSVIFDGSRISPIEEASLVLRRPFEGTDREDLKEEAIVWLHNSTENEVNDTSTGGSESGDSSYDRSLFEDSSFFESSSTSLSTQEDTPSYIQDFDKTGIWVSSLDLEVHNSELVQGKEQGFDVFDSNFPSSSYIAKQNLQFRSCSSSWITPFCQTEEDKSPSEDHDSDEPLFWPFDQNSYWLPEFEKNFLCLSPRKDGRNVGVQGLHGLKSVSLKLQKKKNPPVGGKSMQEECGRILFSSQPKSAAGECKTRGSNNKSIQNFSTTPSRLSKSVQASSKKYPCNISMKERQLLLEAKSQKHSCDEELLNKPLLELEGSDFQNLVMEGVPIEKLVGLNEFDGHEGLSVEFDKDEFTLNGSPFEKMISSKDIECSTDNSHATLGSWQRKLFTDDCSESHTEGYKDLVDVQLSESHVHGLKVS